MASMSRMALLRSAATNITNRFSFARWTHALARPSPLNNFYIDRTWTIPFILPEDRQNDVEFVDPNFPYSGSMELMAVPKKKTSPHKRGIRNGPKALKPTPVIVRCTVCGRVKLPHFYCCSGIRENPSEQNDQNS